MDRIEAGTCRSTFRNPFTAIVGFTIGNKIYFDYTTEYNETSTYPSGVVRSSRTSREDMIRYKNTTVWSFGYAEVRLLLVHW